MTEIFHDLHKIQLWFSRLTQRIFWKLLQPMNLLDRSFLKQFKLEIDCFSPINSSTYIILYFELMKWKQFNLSSRNFQLHWKGKLMYRYVLGKKNWTTMLYKTVQNKLSLYTSGFPILNQSLFFLLKFETKRFTIYCVKRFFQDLLHVL